MLSHVLSCKDLSVQKQAKSLEHEPCVRVHSSFVLCLVLLCILLQLQGCTRPLTNIGTLFIYKNTHMNIYTKIHKYIFIYFPMMKYVLYR